MVNSETTLDVRKKRYFENQFKAQELSVRLGSGWTVEVDPVNINKFIVRKSKKGR